jgi:sugar phosphate isomerase/epimerase
VRFGSPPASANESKRGLPAVRYGAMNFPIRPVLEEIELVSRMGFDYVELTMDPPQAHHASLSRDAAKIRDALERSWLGLVCHLPSFVSTADLTPGLRRASVREMEDSLRVASDLGALKVVLHPSFVVGLGVLVPDQVREYARESLEAAVGKADRLGLTVCLENMFPASNSLVRPEDFVPVFQTFPNLRLTLDIGHAHVGSTDGSRFLAFVAAFPDRLAHVHASDNSGRGDDHLPIGAGMIDYARAARALRRIGYDQTVTLEVFSRDRDYLRISREKLDRLLSESCSPEPPIAVC